MILKLLQNDLENRFFYRFDEDINALENIDLKSEDFYLLAKESLDIVVTNPYTKTIEDREFFVFTALVPIVFENIFIGVVGIDYDLRYFQHFINSLHFKDGFLSLISNNFVYATNINSGKLNKNIGYSEDKEEIKRVLKLKGQYIKELRSEEFEQDLYHIYTPVKFNSLNWYLLMSVDEDTLSVDKKFRFFIFTLVLLFIFLIIYLILSYFLNPISFFAKEFKEIVFKSLKMKPKDEDLDDIELLFKNLSYLEEILKDKDKKFIEFRELKKAVSKKDMAISRIKL